MASAWSSADPTRRRLFLVGMAIVVAILGWVGYEQLTAKPPSTRSQPRPSVAVIAQPRESTIVVPPGHEDGDGAVTPPSAQQPLQLPPRFDKPPALPVSDADLKAASELSMTFLEVFANGRWDDKADDKVQAIRTFVPAASLDLVLAQYERTRARPETHEVVTFRVTGAQWWSLSDRQLTLLTTGERRVIGDGGNRTEARGFVLTLTRSGSGWKVISVRDPAEGDAGMGTR